ncbi:MAG: trypsin-like peptidase domain-containing protein [Betaproteobacteria bacterium]|nr:trypsin-like peptidase domain-containing protein [Betaproteobacteria bacterium]
MNRTATAFLLAAATFAGWGVSAQKEAERPVEPRAVAARGPLLEAERNLVQLFDNAAPSVAYITTERIEQNFFFAEVAQGAGSGFVWDHEGHVVTNFHVIQNARKVLVQLDAGKDPISAEYVGAAPEYDLAVVKLKKTPAGIKPIPLGTSRDLKIGQSVVAIGNPFGLQRTLTTGIISALDRYLPTQNYAEIAGAIQTDAAINPGNSGGPLLDSAGRLIGVNTAIRSASGSSAGVGFAIPVDIVNRIVPQLIARGEASSPGIGITAVDPGLVARNGIKGVVIRDVRRNTPAAQAGLQALSQRTGKLGDIIVAINGRPVDTLSTFIAELDRAGIGNTAEFTIRREGKERKERMKVIDTSR